MIKMIYLAVLFLLIIGILVQAQIAGERKEKISRVIRILLYVAVVTIVFNTIYVMAEAPATALLAYSAFGASMDALLVIMLQYVRLFTEHPAFGRGRYVLYGCAAADMVSLLCNPLFGHEFTLAGGTSDLFGAYFYPDTYSVLYVLHILFSYVLTAAILLLLYQKIRRIPSDYRLKYVVVFIGFLLIVLVNALPAFFHQPLDLSPLIYSLVGLVICYFTLVYEPNAVIRQMLLQTMQTVDLGVACFDYQDRCIYLNQRGREYYRSYRGLGAGEDVAEIDADFHRWLQDNWDGAESEQVCEEEYAGPYGRRFFEITVRRLSDKKGRHLGYHVYIEDQTAEREHFLETIYRATHDEVTGLYNADYFYQRVSEELHAHPDVTYVMVASDIKDFKFINDFFGSEVGDDLLRMHSGMFREYAKEGAVYGRVGMDKFAYCMPKERYSEDIFIRSMNRLVDQFSNRFFKIQIYMGVYEITDPDEPVYAMCDKCGLVISKIKGDYSQRIAYYDDSVLEADMQKNAIINEFDDALLHGEFEMYLQAQTRADGTLVGAEALARWKHPQKGMIPPGEFIPVLENAGLIYRLDLYIWNLAAKQLSQWRKEGHGDIPISVNVSAKDQYYLDLFETFRDLVETYGVEPSMLKLEITETIFIEEVEKHLNLISRLQEYGFEVEIDDFGSGYSSLNILKDISANVLKIDMGFLRGTGNVKRSQDIIAAVIRLAHSLNMTVITEGVETAEQLEMLSDMGCGIFQGYYFAKPEPVEQFEKDYGFAD